MNNKGINKQTFICKNCNTVFPHKGYSNFYHKFCTTTCSSEYKKKTNRSVKLQQFKDGTLVERKYIYEFLVERDGNTCSVCGITEWQSKPIRLWVDHIDGDASNNRSENFRLICPNCDSQSETFGAKNTGRGRKSRGLKTYG